MKIALTGATGLVGRALANGLRAAGHDVTALSRPTFDLAGPIPSLAGHDALIHAGFAHIPGKYRGGEGDDPATFTKLNVDGSLNLFARARRDGVTRILFLSSRAVYGAYPPGTPLHEKLPPRPDTLYGQVKWAVEQALPNYAPHTISLRATGIYGPGPGHKWSALFNDFRAGRPIPPRVATELHADDLTQAANIGLTLPGHHRLNVSDLMLDRHDLLREIARLTQCPHPLPYRADPTQISAMDTTQLRATGWHPGGWPKLIATLPALLPSSL